MQRRAMSHPLRRLAPILGLAALLQGCGRNVDVDVAEPEPLPQGIVGTVTKATGDFMCCPSTGKVAPLSVPVHVIRGKVAYESGKPPPALADLPVEISVHSDEDGLYGAGLAPGTYTTFAEIDGELYRNDYTGGSTPSLEIYFPTEVVAGAFTRADIEDSSEATY